MFLLDSNMAIAAINDRPPIVANTIAARAMAGARIAVSTITVFELRYGIAKSRSRMGNERSLENFLRHPVEILTFDDIAAAHAGTLRATLEAEGTPIGPYDLLIAGHALRLGATLVTANLREFGRVRGLEVEDWGAV